MRKITSIGLLLLIGGFAAQAEPEIKGTAEELAKYINAIPKTTLVTGEAEVRVPAKRAVVSIRVVTESRTLQEALRLNGELRTKVTDHLKTHGLRADQIHSSRFSSTPKFGMFGEKAKSYRVENLMRITVQEEKEFQSAAATVDMWSEVQFAGVEFEYEDREALKAKAIAQACDKANERSKIYEERLGLKLTPVSFNEGVVSQRDTRGSNYAGSKNYTGLSGGSGSAPSEAEPTGGGESISSFGELVYTARVTVEYSTQGK